MRISSLYASGLVALFSSNLASAFSTLPGTTAGQSNVALNAHCSDRSTSLDRATFLKTSLASIAAVSFSPSNAFAEDAVDDLSMPSAEEQKASEDAMAERLRKKAELQQKARKPMGYQESIAQEMNKQKSLQKTKDERRAALCEELGRGC
mmetsp:Transcript_22368/g.47142  ORF Transcript_22368/g.47142 Transcript_22368/m.47142 type:complete len:150 (+) Transcript_22368:103-552(+)|eukprot:CAMPEP_0183729218 /NCGR_PEP_ID=MMETSP0737-20130205/29959_1 /TAXON_ID=385413 /ORGANISM="Thalassiosira miniscula, Strain CCMP1093" /LENGTH=149 /DNA_ID=CAMNT_0025961365 /DNA_START=64 /DNA_END=513 /DNA_ORIENTATION=+